MAGEMLLYTALLALGTSGGFATCGVACLRRAHPRRGRSARVMFLLFWFSAAGITAAQGLLNLLAFLDQASFGLVSALDQTMSIFYALAGASLLYFSIYLITGRARFLAPILAFYTVAYFLLRWRVEAARRVDIDVGTHVVAFVYEHPLQGPAYTAIVMLFALPILVSLGLYGALLFRVRDLGLRYRIALTTLGLFTWVLTEAVTYATGWANTDVGELVRRFVALGAGVVLVLAYHPPRFARERWGAENLF